MSDTLQRRNRMKRTPSGRGIRLNGRDIRVFDLLYRYAMLDSADLAAFIKPTSHKRFIERLGALFHDGGYIDRPTQQWQMLGALYKPVTCSLSKRGMIALQYHDRLPNRVVISNAGNHGTNLSGRIRPQFQHSVLISKAIAQVEIFILDTDPSEEASKRLVPIGEIIEKLANRSQLPKPASSTDLSIPVTIPRSRDDPTNLRTSIVPDGLYGIEYQTEGLKRYRFFALEVELTNPLKRKNMVQSSFLKKLLAYKATIHSKSYQSALGIPNLFVHFVTKDKEKLDRMVRLAGEVLSEEELRLFRFTVCKT